MKSDIIFTYESCFKTDAIELYESVSTCFQLPLIYRASVGVVLIASVKTIHSVLRNISRNFSRIFTLVLCYHSSDAYVIPGLMFAV